jgi:tetratricopeptide (TPR) repeat protein
MTKLLIAEKLLRLYQSKQSGDLSDFLLLRFYNVYL